MKLTKSQLRKIIKEELGRMNIGSSGIPSPPVEPLEQEEEFPDDSRATLDELYKMTKSAHSVAKADPSVPSHVVRSLSNIAAKVASLLGEQ